MRTLIKAAALLVLAMLLTTTLFVAMEHIEPAGIDPDWLRFGAGPSLEGQGRNGTMPPVVIRIDNATGTSYLRQQVYTYYSDGQWSSNDSYMWNNATGYLSYNPWISDMTFNEVGITPSAPLYGWMPSFKDVYMVGTMEDDIEGCPYYNTLAANKSVDHTYYLTFIVSKYDQQDLTTLTPTIMENSTNVPTELRSRFEPYLDELLTGISNPFYRIKAIYNDVSKHPYYSNLGWTGRNVTGDEMLYDFVENGSYGNSLTFATAFVMLARTAGYSARMVQGYHIDPDAVQQFVTLNDPAQVFYYAEVFFVETGWLLLDPTPRSSTPDPIGAPYVRPPTNDPTIYGTCYRDLNMNGYRDLEDELCVNIPVSIWNETVKLRQVFTDSQGMYSLPFRGTGSFTIKGVAPDHVNGRDYDSVMAYVYVNENWPYSNYVELRFANQTPQLDQGKVFFDSDRDGVIDNGEGGVPGIRVDALGTNSMVVETAVTGNDGTFRFSTDPRSISSVALRPQGPWSVPGNSTYGTGGNAFGNIIFGVYSSSYQPTPTITNITDVSLDLRRDGPFNINGTVRTGTGRAADGLDVLIYLSKEKNGTDRYLCGRGMTQNGTFQIECMVPFDQGVGQYQLIALNLGNNLYGRSESDPSVVVSDNTTIQLTSGTEYEVGNIAKLTILLEQASTGVDVVNASVSVSVAGQDFTVTTSSDGVADLYIDLPDVGTYPVTMSYAGEVYLKPTTLSTNITAVKRQLDLFFSSLVIGEDNEVSGRLRIGNLTTGICFIGLEMAGIKAEVATNNLGLFEAQMFVPSSYTRGIVKCNLTVNTEAFAVENITLRERPILKADVQGGRMHVTLTDTGSLSLGQRTIWVSTPGGRSSYVTGDDGSVDVAISRGSEYNITVEFPGEQFYADAVVTITVKPSGMDLIWLLPLGVAAAIAAGAYRHYHPRKKAPVMVETAPTAIVPDSPLASKVSAYSISIENVPAGFPPVLGEGIANIAVLGPPGRINFGIDDDTKELDLTGQWRTSLNLSKGTYRLTAGTAEDRTVLELRIVDYREEIVRVYQEAFSRWRNVHGWVRDDMGPREAQAALLGRGLDQGALEDLTALVERAEFSQHEVGRKEYEKAYLAMRRLIG